MKRLAVLLSAVGLVAACSDQPDRTAAPLSALDKFVVTTVNGQAESCADLLAGQTIPAGRICYEVNADDDLVVTYTTSGGWEIEEAHLWVGSSPDGYPQTKSGNPKNGQFPYASGDITGATTYSFVVDLAQFNLDIAQCDPGNFLYSMAHAALRKGDGTGGYQTETGWADGDPSGAKNWSTVVALELVDDSCGGGGPTGNKCFDHETAFAFDGDQSGCFQNYPDYLDNPKRWGWTNGPIGPDTYTWDVYAGAGLCDLSKGTKVGTATLVYDTDGTATVTYNITGGWILETTHAYVGTDEFATNNQGEFTLAPGQYGSTNDFNPADGSTTSVHTFTGLSGDVYAVLHAAVLHETVCVDD